MNEFPLLETREISIFVGVTKKNIDWEEFYVKI